MSIVLLGSTSGSITLQEPAVAGNTVLSLPATSGTVAINGPAFRAFINSTSQTVTENVWTKVTLTAETFDTNSCFDSTTNYRFTPNVAGYYQINGTICNALGASILIAAIYKNGTIYVGGTDTRTTTNSLAGFVSDVVYFNGTTDYVELYGYISGRTTFAGGGSGQVTVFSGSMVRGA